MGQFNPMLLKQTLVLLYFLRVQGPPRRSLRGKPSPYASLPALEGRYLSFSGPSADPKGRTENAII